MMQGHKDTLLRHFYVTVNSVEQVIIYKNLYLTHKFRAYDFGISHLP